MMKQWIRLALRRDIVLRSVRVGAIVGTELVAINQGDMLLGGQADPAAAWKIPLTYLVPYCVSTYASVSAAIAASR